MYYSLAEIWEIIEFVGKMCLGCKEPERVVVDAPVLVQWGGNFNRQPNPPHPLKCDNKDHHSGKLFELKCYFSLIFYFHCRMLKDNPELYQLYKDLVVSNVITAEEFWANRGKVFDTDFTGVLYNLYQLAVTLY